MSKGLIRLAYHWGKQPIQSSASWHMSSTAAFNFNAQINTQCSTKVVPHCEHYKEKVQLQARYDATRTRNDSQEGWEAECSILTSVGVAGITGVAAIRVWWAGTSGAQSACRQASWRRVRCWLVRWDTITYTSQSLSEHCDITNADRDPNVC